MVAVDETQVVERADGTAAQPAPVRPRRRRGRRAWRVGQQLAVLAGLFVAWQVWAGWRGSFFFPQPTDIFVRLYENWFSGPIRSGFLTEAFGRDIAPSLRHMALGWGIAVVAGVALGVALGIGRRLSAYVDPIVHFLRSAPGPALLPIFLLLFGIGTQMKVAFIAFGSVWPILLNTVGAVRSVDPRFMETAVAYRCGRAARVFHVLVPSAMPMIVAGMRISLSIALVLMVVSDMLVAYEGFGFVLIQAQREFRILDLWAGIVLLGILGFVLNGVFTLGERWFLGWHRGYRGRSND